MTYRAATGRSFRRTRYASRGQALILAVLIMFVLTGLGGVFIAMISTAMVQTAQAVERARLESIAQAGLRYAENQLRYSPDGADWRPDQGPDANNPGWQLFSAMWSQDTDNFARRLSGTQGELGFYKITLTYGPTSTDDIGNGVTFLDNPLDRFLRIDVEARYALENAPSEELESDDPDTYDLYRRGFLSPKRFLTRKITAYMPLGLPDHLLWITNIDGNPEPVNLGTELLLTDQSDSSSGMATVSINPLNASDSALNSATSRTTLDLIPYLSVYNGPIRSDVGVKLGNARIDLTQDDASYANVTGVRARELMEVVGELTLSDGASAVSIMANAHHELMSSAVAFRPLSGDREDRTHLRFLQTRRNNPLIRALKAPLLDQRDPVSGAHRYRALTRETGIWANESASATAVSYYHTGLIGWGEGVYVNNPEHIQHAGDLKALRAEWLNSSAENWVSGVYQPNDYAVEVILHDYEYGSAAAYVTRLPYIELRRTDGTPFRNAQNQEIGDRMTMPYPRNGVLYAEGNLIVKGHLPASLAFTKTAENRYDSMPGAGGTQLPGGQTTINGPIRYYVNPANRRYDLTIVSGGTIYIEGNLLSPSSRRLADGITPVAARGSAQDSKLALLAMDNICLNPTRLFSVEKASELGASPVDRFWRARAGDSITLNFSTAGPITDRTRLLLRHAGQNQLFNPLYAAMRMWVNNQPYRWDAAAADPTKFFFCNDTLRGTFGLTAQQWSPSFFDPNWTMQFTSVGSLNNSATNVQLYGYGAQNTIRFDWLEGTTDYLLSAGGEQLGTGFVVTPAEIQVDALMYAQRGSWFIIPGRFYNEDPLLNVPWPYPKYREPLDVRIIVNGAIVENRPAPPEAEEAWQRHWCGSPLAYYDENGDKLPDLWDPGDDTWDGATQRWTNRRMGIEYHYDPTLARPVCFEVDPANPQMRYYRPRLPKLPVSPSIFSFTAVRGA